MAENRIFKEAPNALVAMGAILVIFVIIIPLPTALLDFFMALNLIFSFDNIANSFICRQTYGVYGFPFIAFSLHHIRPCPKRFIYKAYSNIWRKI